MKATITVERENYRPGEEIRGSVTWANTGAPKSAKLQLFWHTSGKGDTDDSIADSLTFDLPQADDTRPFQFHAPAFPYSFSGKLISLVWSLELVMNSESAEIIDITISPDGTEIELQDEALITMADPGKSNVKFGWNKSR